MADNDRTPKPTVGSDRLKKLFAGEPKKLTQEVAAVRCGVEQQTISDWAAGNKTPKYENRKKLRDEFGIDVDAWDVPIAAARPKAKRAKSSTARAAGGAR